MTKLQRLEFLLHALAGVGRIDQKQKVIYLDFDIQLSPVNAHDIQELKENYKFRVQYQIPC
jgi:hypothetical protein